MKRVIAPVLLIIALFLSGCGESERMEASLEEARAGWAGAESISFTADVVADMGDSVFECSLKCTRSDGENLVEILSPDSIAGISARLKDGEAQIEYDGLILAIGSSMESRVSPISAMPVLMEAMLKGNVTGIWAENDGEQKLAAAEVFVAEGEYAKLWFDTESFAPCHGELVIDGQAVVKCGIKSFTEE